MKEQVKISALCREVNKSTGEIISYLVKEGIDDHDAFLMGLRARANPELEYFATLIDPEEEDFEDALSMLKEREPDYEALKIIGVVKL